MTCRGGCLDDVKAAQAKRREEIREWQAAQVAYSQDPANRQYVHTGDDPDVEYDKFVGEPDSAEETVSDAVGKLNDALFEQTVLLNDKDREIQELKEKLEAALAAIEAANNSRVVQDGIELAAIPPSAEVVDPVGEVTVAEAEPEKVEVEEETPKPRGRPKKAATTESEGGEGD